MVNLKEASMNAHPPEHCPACGAELPPPPGPQAYRCPACGFEVQYQAHSALPQYVQVGGAPEAVRRCLAAPGCRRCGGLCRRR